MVRILLVLVIKLSLESLNLKPKFPCLYSLKYSTEVSTLSPLCKVSSKAPHGKIPRKTIKQLHYGCNVFLTIRNSGKISREILLWESCEHIGIMVCAWLYTVSSSTSWCSNSRGVQTQYIFLL